MMIYIPHVQAIYNSFGVIHRVIHHFKHKYNIHKRNNYDIN